MEISFQHKLSECITPALSQTSVQSFVLSKKYVHIMLKASLFNILYRRLPVNENELIKKRFENSIPFVVHKSTHRHGVKDPWFKIFCYWLPAIEDTIKKNYLQTLFLFMRDSENTILETYRFDLKYNKDSNFSYKTEDQNTPKEVTDATKVLLSSILKLGSLDKLGTDTSIEIEISVTDDCPVHYQPPFFKVRKNPICGKIRNFSLLGEIDTGFHKLAARSSDVQIPIENTNLGEDIETINMDLARETPYSDVANSTANNAKRKVEAIIDPTKGEKFSRRKFDNSGITISDIDVTMDSSAWDVSKDDTEIPIENTNLGEDIETINMDLARETQYSDVANSTANNAKRKVEAIDLTKEVKFSRRKFNNSGITISDSEETMDSSASDVSLDDTDIFCICKLQAPDDVKIIHCDSCQQPFHAVCFGYFSEQPKTIFKCDGCNTKDKQRKKRPIPMHITATLRLILFCITKNGQIPKEIIKSISEVDEKEVCERLKDLKLLERESTSLSECKIKYSEIAGHLRMLENDEEDSLSSNSFSD